MSPLITISDIWAGAIVVVSLLTAYQFSRNARRRPDGRRTLRLAKTTICLLFSLVYTITLLYGVDTDVLSLYARPLLLMLLLALLGGELMDRV